MRQSAWGGELYAAESASLAPQYNLLELMPGQTLRRTLLWVDVNVEYTSVDSLSGTPYSMGLILDPSASSPSANPQSAWSDPVSGQWLWTWNMPVRHAYVVPGASPAQYISKSPDTMGHWDIPVERRNDTAHPLYLWFLGQVFEGVTGPNVFTMVTARCNFLTAG